MKLNFIHGYGAKFCAAVGRPASQPANKKNCSKKIYFFNDVIQNVFPFIINESVEDGQLAEKFFLPVLAGGKWYFGHKIALNTLQLPLEGGCYKL